MRVLAMLFALSACTGEPSAPAVSEPRASHREVTPPPPPPPSGAVAVRVLAPGATLPKVDPACTGKAPLRLELDASGALAGAAVWVMEAASTPKPKAATLRLTGCGVEPQVAVITPDSALAFQNMEATARKVSLLHGELEVLSRDLPAGGTAGSAIATPGLSLLRCAPGPCLGAVAVGGVVGLTGSDGRVTLSGALPGPQVVRVYHPAVGEGSATVQIEENGTAQVEITLKP